MGAHRKMRALSQLIPLLIMVGLWSEAGSHGGELRNIEIEDEQLRRAVVTAACGYLGQQGLSDYCRGGISFDYYNGKIAVNFTRRETATVLVFFSEWDVSGHLQIYGFRASKRMSQRKVSVSQTKAREAAQLILDELPQAVREELRCRDVELAGEAYLFTWNRVVRGVPVLGEGLSVVVDASNGRVVQWELDVFDFPTSVLAVHPQLGMNEAVRIAVNQVPQRLPVAVELVADVVARLVFQGRDLFWVLLFSNGRPDTEYFRYAVLVNTENGKLELGGRIPELETKFAC